MNRDGDTTHALVPTTHANGKNTGGTQYTKNEHGPTKTKTKCELQGKKRMVLKEGWRSKSAKTIWKTEKLL